MGVDGWSPSNWHTMAQGTPPRMQAHQEVNETSLYHPQQPAPYHPPPSLHLPSNDPLYVTLAFASALHPPITSQSHHSHSVHSRSEGRREKGGGQEGDRGGGGRGGRKGNGNPPFFFLFFFFFFFCHQLFPYFFFFSFFFPLPGPRGGADMSGLLVRRKSTPVRRDHRAARGRARGRRRRHGRLLGANAPARHGRCARSATWGQARGGDRSPESASTGRRPRTSAARGSAHVPAGRGTFMSGRSTRNLRLGALRRRDAEIAADIARDRRHFPVLRHPDGPAGGDSGGGRAADARDLARR